jgi:hypothetical protein
MTDQTTPAGISTANTPTVMNLTPTAEIYDKVMDYLKSINLPFMVTNDGIKLTVNNVVVDMYVYNSAWVLRAVINDERNSLTSDMYVKQMQTHWGSYLLSYEKNKTKLWVKVKLTGNSVWDVNAPIIAIATAVELAGKSLEFLLPQSLQQTQ